LLALLSEVLAAEEHIHTHSHPVDKVEYRIVEEEWHKGFAVEVRRKGSEEEYHKDSVGEYHRGSEEDHILNMVLLHWRVVPVLH
jgi:hypothetical protein